MMTLGLIFLSACKEQPSKYYDPNYDQADFSPTVLPINSYGIDDFPFCSNKRQLLAHFGKPDRIIDQNIRLSNSEVDSIKFSTYLYGDSLVYNVHNDSAVIEFADFANSDLPVSVRNKRLNNQSNFRLMKSLFPESYDWRNAGVGNASWRCQMKILRIARWISL